jgi:transposase InsO family protein
MAHAGRREGALHHARSPWENGYNNESLDGSLCDKLLNGYSLAEGRVLIEVWRRYYNTVRSHSNLGHRPPALEAATPQLPASSLLRSNYDRQWRMRRQCTN